MQFPVKFSKEIILLFSTHYAITDMMMIEIKILITKKKKFLHRGK